MIIKWEHVCKKCKLLCKYRYYYDYTVIIIVLLENIPSKNIGIINDIVCFRISKNEQCGAGLSSEHLYKHTLGTIYYK